MLDSYRHMFSTDESSFCLDFNDGSGRRQVLGSGSETLMLTSLDVFFVVDWQMLQLELIIRGHFRRGKFPQLFPIPTICLNCASFFESVNLALQNKYYRIIIVKAFTFVRFWYSYQCIKVYYQWSLIYFTEYILKLYR